MDCNISAVTNRTDGFSFDKLFAVYLYLNSTCAPDSDIFFQGTQLMTAAVCRKITGTRNSIQGGWSPYELGDAWNRLVTWKLPLTQLVAQFPRPPLGWRVETATLIHLLGDPIDSFASLILTLALCKSRVARAKKLCLETQGGRSVSPDEYYRTWKAVAMIMISYDTCGASMEVNLSFSEDFRDIRAQEDMRSEFDLLCIETGYALAADRSTRTLPVIFAEVIFLGGWMIALGKAASSEPNPTNWPNVELQSVAISAMYLWVTSAVAIGAFVGTSQTENSVPRILDDFERRVQEIQSRPRRSPKSSPELVLASRQSVHSTSIELKELPTGLQDQMSRRFVSEAPEAEVELPLTKKSHSSISGVEDISTEWLVHPTEARRDEVVVEVGKALEESGNHKGFETTVKELNSVPAQGRRELPWATGIDRAVSGGVLNWKPYKWVNWYDHWLEDGIGRGSLVAYSLVGVGFVGMGYATAAVLSSLPPPRGFSCRHITETLMFVLWLLSFGVELLLERLVPDWIFWGVFWKDLFFAVSNTAIVVAIQVGVMNSCACWSKWGQTGLHLPQLSEVKPELMYMAREVAPWWVASAVVLHLVLCLGVLCFYGDAVRVYIQRDDGLSNWPNWIISTATFVRVRTIRLVQRSSG